jgi:hypothetical protein
VVLTAAVVVTGTVVVVVVVVVDGGSLVVGVVVSTLDAPARGASVDRDVTARSLEHAVATSTNAAAREAVRLIAG